MIKGDPPSAEPMLRRALDIILAAFPDGNSQVSYRQVQLGRCLMEMGLYGEAEPYLARAFDWLLETRGLENSYTTEVGVQLITLYEGLGRPASAARYRRLLEGAGGFPGEGGAGIG